MFFLLVWIDTSDRLSLLICISFVILTNAYLHAVTVSMEPDSINYTLGSWLLHELNHVSKLGQQNAVNFCFRSPRIVWETMNRHPRGFQGPLEIGPPPKTPQKTLLPDVGPSASFFVKAPSFKAREAHRYLIKWLGIFSVRGGDLLDQPYAPPAINSTYGGASRGQLIDCWHQMSSYVQYVLYFSVVVLGVICHQWVY